MSLITCTTSPPFLLCFLTRRPVYRGSKREDDRCVKYLSMLMMTNGRLYQLQQQSLFGNFSNKTRKKQSKVWKVLQNKSDIHSWRISASPPGCCLATGTSNCSHCAKCCMMINYSRYIFSNNKKHTEINIFVLLVPLPARK